MGIDELRLLHMVEDGFQNGRRLFVRHALDADGHQAVHIERLAAALVVGAHDGVVGFAEGLGALAIALLHGAVVVEMLGPLAVHLGAQGRVQRVPGRIAAGEERIAAMGGDLDRIEHGRRIGIGGVDHVVVEHHLAIGQRADGLAILADVRDQHDVGQDLVEARREIFGRTAHVADGAEIAGHAQQVFLRQLLPAKHDHGMLQEGCIDGCDVLIPQGLGHVEAAHFGADMGVQRNDFEAACGGG